VEVSSLFSLLDSAIDQHFDDFFSAINGSEAGLVLSTLFMATFVPFLALKTAETENNLISVKRIMEYGQLQSEAPLESTEGIITHH